MVGGKRAVDYFEGKIADHGVRSMKRVSAIPTETLLFNVDSKGGKWKEGDTAKTALLRSFQRVFYENRGFYGETSSSPSSRLSSTRRARQRSSARPSSA